MYKANISTGLATASVSTSPPPGSIMAYLGTSDPDGWVIADGNQRTNGADGRYNNLVSAPLSIGSGSLNGNYTPPDYRGAFLRGAGKNGTDTSYEGGSVGAKQQHATQNHTHTVTDPGHGHNYSYGWPGTAADTSRYFWSNTLSNRGELTNASTLNSLLSITSNTTGITLGNSFTSSNANETRPYNYGVNWIIKL